jgi:hypothetical protein
MRFALTDVLACCPEAARRIFVPKGLDEGSQAIYCLETGSRATRPVGYGMIGFAISLFHRRRQTNAGTRDHIVPYGTDQFLTFPGNKLAGYLHRVRPGQKSNVDRFFWHYQPSRQQQ